MKQCKEKLIVSILFGCSAGIASYGVQAIEIQADPWTLNINGNVNGHLSYVQCDDSTNVVAGNPLLCTGDDATSVANGYLPTGIDFGISRTVNDYHVAVHFAYEGGTVTNGPFNGGGTTESFRGYLTVENEHYGEVKIGRDYGVFGIDVILSDMSLLGVGASAIIKSPLNTTLGSSGYGYIFVDRLAQINYSFPTKNGLSATVGVYQPLDPSTLGAENTFVGDSGSKTPGFHGKLKYEFEKGFISSTWLTQQIDNSEVNETAFAWDVTGKMNFGALSLVASYHDAKGVGHSGLFFDGIDAQGNARNSNGYFVQAMYSFTDTRLGINYGISTLDRNANDPLINLKQSEKVTFGAYHSLFEGLTLVAEVSLYESENNKNQSIDNLGVNLGAVYFF